MQRSQKGQISAKNGENGYELTPTHWNEAHNSL